MGEPSSETNLGERLSCICALCTVWRRLGRLINLGHTNLPFATALQHRLQTVLLEEFDSLDRQPTGGRLLAGNLPPTLGHIGLPPPPVVPPPATALEPRREEKSSSASRKREEKKREKEKAKEEKRKAKEKKKERAASKERKKREASLEPRRETEGSPVKAGVEVKEEQSSEEEEGAKRRKKKIVEPAENSGSVTLREAADQPAKNSGPSSSSRRPSAEEGVRRGTKKERSSVAPTGEEGERPPGDWTLRPRPPDHPPWWHSESNWWGDRSWRETWKVRDPRRKRPKNRGVVQKRRALDIFLHGPDAGRKKDRERKQGK